MRKPGVARGRSSARVAVAVMWSLRTAEESHMRRRTLALIASSAISVGLSHAASAADLGRRAAPAPVMASVYNWTGLYVGAHAGWGHVDTDASTTWTPIGFGDPFTYSHDGNGFLAGGQIGFNYQIANWVVGVEDRKSVV